MKTEPGSALDRLLTLSLIAAPVIYLIADSLYAARGWDDPTAAVFHVLGAIAYTFLLLRVVTWSDGILAAVLLFIGAFGVAGNVAYGFNTIHVSLGDTDLVDTAGAATLIKPLGLCFPLMLLLTAATLRGTRNVWISAVLAVAGVAWPVAHIANIAWLAVLVNAALVVVFSALTVAAPRAAAGPVKEPVGTA
jgi:hypothetical protein